MVLPLAFIYLIFESFFLIRHEFMAFEPARSKVTRPESGWQTVDFTTDDRVKLSAWYSPTQNGKTIVLLHGYSGNRNQLLPLALRLKTDGFGVLAYDTRAHGESEGSVIGFGEKEVMDVKASLDWLVKRPEVDSSRLGIYGFSLGGIFALRQAINDPRIASLVLAGTPASLYELAQDESGGGLRGLFTAKLRYLAMRWVGSSKYSQPARETIKSLKDRPILLITGSQDALVPPNRARELFEAAGYPKAIAIFPEAGHGDYNVCEPERFYRLITGFYNDTLKKHRALSSR